MRKAIIIAVISCIMPKIQAQRIVEKSFNFNNKRMVVLDLQIIDSIDIQTWNKSELYVYGTINVNDNKDNEIYQTSFSEAGDRIDVQAKFDEDYFKGKNHNVETEIAWKVMLPETAELSVKTINGNIIIKGKTTSVKAHTISGFIDMGLPADKKADLDLKTITGNIYTDLNLPEAVNKREMELRISQKLNGGGVPINLETISGDIFLRKK